MVGVVDAFLLCYGYCEFPISEVKKSIRLNLCGAGTHKQERFSCSTPRAKTTPAKLDTNPARHQPQILQCCPAFNSPPLGNIGLLISGHSLHGDLCI